MRSAARVSPSGLFATLPAPFGNSNEIILFISVMEVLKDVAGGQI
jgi:hypothetical protein